MHHIHFTQFPAEILRMILSHLDVKSKLRLWDAFGEFLDAHSWPGLHRVCFVRSRLPARALDSRLLRENVRELDLSCVPNLLRRASALTLLPNLHSLDLSYTDLPLEDAVAVCAACSSLTRLTVDYLYCPEEEVPSLESYISMRNLNYIHLIGNFSPLLRCSRLIDILSFCNNLNELKLTALSYQEDVMCSHKYSSQTKRLPIKRFSVHIQFFEPEFTFKTLSDMPLVRLLNCDLWEHALIEHKQNQLMRLFLSPNFHRSPITIPYLQPQMDDSILKLILFDIDYRYTVHMWHPDLATLKPNFYKDVVEKICKLIPQSICKEYWDESRVGPKESFVLGVCTLGEVGQELEPAPSYTARIPPTTAKLDLNIHKFIKTERPISVRYERCACLQEDTFCNIILNQNFKVLTHIVNLDLCFLKVSFHVLKVLLIKCCNLKTFCINLNSNNYQNIEDYVSLNKSVQNIKIVTNGDCNLGIILCGLSGCPSLENLIICANETLCRTSVGLLDYFNFFQNCPNLLSYHYSTEKNIRMDLYSHSKMISESLENLERPEITVKLFGKDDQIGGMHMDRFENICYTPCTKTSFLDV